MISSILILHINSNLYSSSSVWYISEWVWTTQVVLQNCLQLVQFSIQNTLFLLHPLQLNTMNSNLWGWFTCKSVDFNNVTSKCLGMILRDFCNSVSSGTLFGIFAVWLKFESHGFETVEKVQEMLLMVSVGNVTSTRNIVYCFYSLITTRDLVQLKPTQVWNPVVTLQFT